MVFIWDMDETLIVFQSLVSGSFTEKMPPRKKAFGKGLGMRLMNLILARPPFTNPAP